MSTNRSALFQKLFKVLRKYYEPSIPVERSVLEHLLYACCLENSMPDAADEAFAILSQNYVDWNEVRVTTVSELSEVMCRLTDPVDAARRLKRCLQSVFESKYAFDLEYLKKMPLGKAQAELRQFQGVTSYGVQYVSQHALGGHCIPVNVGVLRALRGLGLISAKDLENQRVPGLERAIPKSKGVELGSLLHQLGVEYLGGPTARLRTILRGVVPDFEFPPAEAVEAVPAQTASSAAPTLPPTVASAASAGPQTPVGETQAAPPSAATGAAAAEATPTRSATRRRSPAVAEPSEHPPATTPTRPATEPTAETKEKPKTEEPAEKAAAGARAPAEKKRPAQKPAETASATRASTPPPKSKTNVPKKSASTRSKKPASAQKRQPPTEKLSTKSLTKRKPK